VVFFFLFFFAKWFEVKGGCSFYWYLWNW
jgi:hypothetical protein